MHRTAASPLALIYAALVVYASLYPFVDWRDQGNVPWAFLAAPVPRYWSAFDVGINVAGYIPLGSMLCLSALRTGRAQHAVWFAAGLCAVLSLVLESVQSYLPVRVASREDLILNAVGGWTGAVGTLLLEKIGAIDRWSRFRSRWFVPEARGGLVLLAIWPLALLFPAAVPFGLGQVYERIESELVLVLDETPFLDWLPVRDIELQPLVPAAEWVCVMLGLLVPCLLGYCVIRRGWRRLVFLLVCVGVGVGVTALSAALSWGPAHAWAWLDLPAQLGVASAGVLALAMSAASGRANAALVLFALGVFLSLLNQAPESAYFAQTLQAWEQGQFIRFHGLAQWLGWCWPYAALAYALQRVGRRDAGH